VSFVDERADLVDEAGDLRSILRVALDDELVAVSADANVEERFEVAKILVIGPEQSLDGRRGDGNLSRRCRWDSRISLSYSNLT